MRDDHTMPGGASEDHALRGLLHGAVEGLEPSDGALERLRYAVPARRILKRQLLVGAAAVALLAGTAIPAALHMTAGEGSTTDRSTMAGHGAQPGSKPESDPSDPHQNGASTPKPRRSPGDARSSAGATGRPDATAGASSSGTVAGPSGSATSTGSVGSTGPVTGTGPLPPVAAPGVPGCGSAQLGVAASSGTPQADGKVYGSFKVTNVSARGCTVTGPDTVTAAPLTADQDGGVRVVGHTPGDPASGLLADPEPAAPVLVLPPDTAYEVQFAWVPSGEACTASPPADTAAGASAGVDAPDSAVEGQTVTTPPAAPIGVAVSHTPESGSPTTRTTIPQACGGTVYRTGPIPVAAPKP